MIILYYFINVPVLGEQNKKKNYIPSNYNVTYITKCMYLKYILI